MPLTLWKGTRKASCACSGIANSTNNKRRWPTVADNRNPNLLILRAPALERLTVTAEAAGSSPVVPAIHSKAVKRISPKPSKARKGRGLRPTSSAYTEALSLGFDSDPPLQSEDKTNDTNGGLGCMLGRSNRLRVNVQR